ncbi:unnamed protein product [Amoebophrya sp. A25]|nr:unnamed protein product [Amoebophrya sp. A25]|eukprot:GSA25T00006175001.1
MASDPCAVDFYQVMGLPAYCQDLNLVRKAYTSLSKERHPDKPGGSKEQFQQLKDAYDTLVDADKKALYDSLYARRFNSTFARKTAASSRGTTTSTTAPSASSSTRSSYFRDGAAGPGFRSSKRPSADDGAREKAEPNAKFRSRAEFRAFYETRRNAGTVPEPMSGNVYERIYEEQERRWRARAAKADAETRGPDGSYFNAGGVPFAGTSFRGKKGEEPGYRDRPGKTRVEHKYGAAAAEWAKKHYAFTRKKKNRGPHRSADGEEETSSSGAEAGEFFGNDYPSEDEDVDDPQSRKRPRKNPFFDDDDDFLKRGLDSEDNEDGPTFAGFEDEFETEAQFRRRTTGFDADDHVEQDEFFPAPEDEFFPGAYFGGRKRRSRSGSPRVNTSFSSSTSHKPRTKAPAPHESSSKNDKKTATAKFSFYKVGAAAPSSTFAGVGEDMASDRATCSDAFSWTSARRVEANYMDLGSYGAEFFDLGRDGDEQDFDRDDVDDKSQEDAQAETLPAAAVEQQQDADVQASDTHLGEARQSTGSSKSKGGKKLTEATVNAVAEDQSADPTLPPAKAVDAAAKSGSAGPAAGKSTTPEGESAVVEPNSGSRKKWKNAAASKKRKDPRKGDVISLSSGSESSDVEMQVIDLDSDADQDPENDFKGQFPGWGKRLLPQPPPAMQLTPPGQKSAKNAEFDLLLSRLEELGDAKIDRGKQKNARNLSSTPGNPFASSASSSFQNGMSAPGIEDTTNQAAFPPPVTPSIIETEPSAASAPTEAEMKKAGGTSSTSTSAPNTSSAVEDASDVASATQLTNMGIMMNMMQTMMSNMMNMASGSNQTAAQPPQSGTMMINNNIVTTMGGGIILPANGSSGPTTSKNIKHAGAHIVPNKGHGQLILPPTGAKGSSNSGKNGKKGKGKDQHASKTGIGLKSYFSKGSAGGSKASKASSGKAKAGEGEGAHNQHASASTLSRDEWNRNREGAMRQPTSSSEAASRPQLRPFCREDGAASAQDTSVDSAGNPFSSLAGGNIALSSKSSAPHASKSAAGGGTATKKGFSASAYSSSSTSEATGTTRERGPQASRHEGRRNDADMLDPNVTLNRNRREQAGREPTQHYSGYSMSYGVDPLGTSKSNYNDDPPANTKGTGSLSSGATSSTTTAVGAIPDFSQMGAAVEFGVIRSRPLLYEGDEKPSSEQDAANDNHNSGAEPPQHRSRDRDRNRRNDRERNNRSREDPKTTRGSQRRRGPRSRERDKKEKHNEVSKTSSKQSSNSARVGGGSSCSSSSSWKEFSSRIEPQSGRLRRHNKAGTNGTEVESSAEAEAGSEATNPFADGAVGNQANVDTDAVGELAAGEDEIYLLSENMLSGNLLDQLSDND